MREREYLFRIFAFETSQSKLKLGDNHITFKKETRGYARSEDSKVKTSRRRLFRERQCGF